MENCLDIGVRLFVTVILFTLLPVIELLCVECIFQLYSSKLLYIFQLPDDAHAYMNNLLTVTDKWNYVLQVFTMAKAAGNLPKFLASSQMNTRADYSKCPY